MDYIIYFAITVGILVFIHEFGHFAAAKLSGMRAEIFAIGFGKRLLGWNKKTGFTFGELPKDFNGEGNTDYRLCLLPLGGYVKITGMVDESLDTNNLASDPQPYEFRAKPLWAKVFVITAGVLMNLLLAWIIFWGGNYFQGKPSTKTTTIGFVEQNSKADSIGLKKGDKIISVNGNKVKNWEELRTEIFINTLGEDVNLLVERDNSLIELNILREDIPEDESQGLFLIPEGIRPAISEVMKDSPAEKAGFKSNDIFLTVNEKPVFVPKDVTEIISVNKEQNVDIKILRQKDTMLISVTPNAEGKIGVALSATFTGEVEYVTYGFFESFYYGWLDILRMTNLTFNMLGKVFSGNVEFKKAFGGPIKIAQFAAKSADSGFSSFLYFLALLSLSLAILNIMPFPVLDGGHLVMILIEGIIKREIPLKVKLGIQKVGMALLLLLMVFILYNDILSLKLW
jgi:regulator of sigma E protease